MSPIASRLIVQRFGGAKHITGLEILIDLFTYPNLVAGQKVPTRLKQRE